MTIRELRQQAIQAYRLTIPTDVSDEELQQRLDAVWAAIAEHAKQHPLTGVPSALAIDLDRDWSPSPEWLRDFLAR